MGTQAFRQQETNPSSQERILNKEFKNGYKKVSTQCMIYAIWKEMR